MNWGEKDESQLLENVIAAQEASCRSPAENRDALKQRLKGALRELYQSGV
jgi:hypothetical protein